MPILALGKRRSHSAIMSASSVASWHPFPPSFFEMSGSFDQGRSGKTFPAELNEVERGVKEIHGLALPHIADALISRHSPIERKRVIFLIVDKGHGALAAHAALDLGLVEAQDHVIAAESAGADYTETAIRLVSELA